MKTFFGRTPHSPGTDMSPSPIEDDLQAHDANRELLSVCLWSRKCRSHTPDCHWLWRTLDSPRSRQQSLAHPDPNIRLSSPPATPLSLPELLEPAAQELMHLPPCKTAAA